MCSAAIDRIKGTCGRLNRGLFLGMLCSLLLLLGARTASAQIAVSLPDTSGAAHETSTIPVEMGRLTGESIFSFEFTVRYNADVLSVTGIETAGTAASKFKTVANTDSSGMVTVSAAATDELSGRETLVKLKVRFEEARTSPLTWETFRFNEGSPSADLSGGTITVKSP